MFAILCKQDEAEEDDIVAKTHLAGPRLKVTWSNSSKYSVSGAETQYAFF